MTTQTPPCDVEDDFQGSASADGAGPSQRPGIGSLLKELRDETTRLMRQEIALVRTEITEKAVKAGANSAYAAAGGMVLLVGVLCLLTALAYGMAVLLARAGLQYHNALWVSWLLVGSVVAVVGFVLLQKGIAALKKISPVPRQTVQSLKEDKQWLKNKLTEPTK